VCRSERTSDQSQLPLKRKLGVAGPGVAIDHGKCRGTITIRLTDELRGSLAKAKRKTETLSACVVRLIERGLGR
jgi:hypothetical protein